MNSDIETLVAERIEVLKQEKHRYDAFEKRTPVEAKQVNVRFSWHVPLSLLF